MVVDLEAVMRKGRWRKRRWVRRRRRGEREKGCEGGCGEGVKQRDSIVEGVALLGGMREREKGI